MEENKEKNFFYQTYEMVTKYFIPTSPQLLHNAQRALLERFVRIPINHKVHTLKDGEYLNYIDIQKNNNNNHENNENNIEKKKKPTLILLHGFGSGLGMYFSNYNSLASRFDRVISMDWIGMGGSSRPRCGAAPKLPLIKTWCSPEPMDPTKATDFFIDRLEEFRKDNEIDNFVLAGHSLGGYLCARYAMKYPNEGMKALILISPAGLAEHPPIELQVPPSELSTPIRLLDVMWSSNFTPQQIVRALGPKGPNTVHSVVKRRFGADRWSESDTSLISNYLYHITAAPASGEYAMNSILKPIVSKRLPSSENNINNDKIENKSQSGHKARVEKSGEDSEELHSTSVYAREPVTPPVFYKSFQSTPIKPPPILLLYGDHDWLRFPGMNKYVQDMNSYKFKTQLVTIPSAGHHLYLDNSDVFHSEIYNWLDSHNIK